MDIKYSGERGRLRWKCRRGMLELDLVLLSFLDKHYDGLTVEQRQTFEKLLDEQDPTLQSWFMRQVLPESKKMAAMVDYIRRVSSR